MALLDQPQARALLADATVCPADVLACQEHLTQFLTRYVPLFYRRELREQATLFIQASRSPS